MVLIYKIIPLSIIIFAGSGDPLVDWLTKAGPIGILAYVVVAFMKGWIVPGAAARASLEETRAQRDKALELVYKQAEISTRALELSGKVEK